MKTELLTLYSWPPPPGYKSAYLVTLTLRIFCNTILTILRVLPFSLPLPTARTYKYASADFF